MCRALEIAVPITVGERTIGALNLESDRCEAFEDDYLEGLRFFADVAGKGVPAALIMATFRALLRAQVASGAAFPEIAARLNQLLSDDYRPHGFVTCLLAELEPTTARLTYVNCGHVPTLLVGAAAVAEEIVRLTRGFTGSTGFEDDFTLVLLARRAGG